MDAVKLRGQRRIDGVGKHRLALDRLNPDQQAISSATLSLCVGKKPPSQTATLIERFKNAGLG
jgi:hypothetical protein